MAMDAMAGFANAMEAEGVDVDRSAPDPGKNDAGGKNELANRARALGMPKVAAQLESTIQASFPEPQNVSFGVNPASGFQRVRSLVPGQDIFTNPNVAAVSAPFIRSLL